MMLSLKGEKELLLYIFSTLSAKCSMHRCILASTLTLRLPEADFGCVMACIPAHLTREDI